MAINKWFTVKFLELALTCVCLGLHYYSFFANNNNELLIITGTFTGYIIILLGGLAGHMMSSPINKPIEIFFCLVGCALFVASGVFTVQYFEYFESGSTQNTGFTKATMAIINGAVFLLDALLTLCDGILQDRNSGYLSM